MKRLFPFFLACLALASCLSAFSAAVPAEIDTSHSSEGIVSVRHVDPAEKRLKVQIKYGGKITYNYDLNQGGAWETFPLQFGDGEYKVSVFENIRGASYAQLCSISFSVRLEDEFSPFLQANQRVNFNEETLAVKKAEKLCRELKKDVDKVDAIYQYVIETYSYDKQKAQDAIDGKLTGYVPDLDEIYRAKSGICYDYAALMAAMLRSQGVPAKLVTGYVAPDSLYHAWNEVYLEGKGWVTKSIYFDGQEWKLMDPTFASSQNNSVSILKFIGNGKNYMEKYYF